VTSIFSPIPFVAHSGATLPFKIDCDGLTDDDIAALAAIAVRRLPSFSNAVGIPRGGDRLAAALQRHATHINRHPFLIVDDVLTAGGSMTEFHNRFSIPPVGLVIFSRIDLAADPALSWIRPIFTLAPWIRK